jgi:hypothetical protein
MRSGPVLALCLFGAAAFAATVRWHQTNDSRYGRAPFSLVAKPASRSIVTGGVAGYTVTVDRGRYTGKMKLTLAPTELLSPAGLRMGNRASLTVHGPTALVSVRTAAADKPGHYVVRINVVGGRYRGYIRLGLTLTAPHPASFKVAGGFGPLWPGTAQAVDLALTNPNSQAISVRSLKVSIKQVSAPRATTLLPCSAADFTVLQFTGGYPLEVPAHTTVRLSDLGVFAARGPKLRMLNRSANQDGCQGATVTLSYSGAAASP